MHSPCDMLLAELLQPVETAHAALWKPAKRIENAVKVNQRRSVEELEALLLRAEKAITIMQDYISRLEGKLQELGVDPGTIGGNVSAPASASASASAPASAPPSAPASAPPSAPATAPTASNHPEDAEQQKPEARQRSNSYVEAHNNIVTLEMRIDELQQKLSSAEQDLREEREEASPWIQKEIDEEVSTKAEKTPQQRQS